MQINFEPNIENALLSLSMQNGQSVEFFVSQAVSNYLEDMEDISQAKKILAEKNQSWSQEEMEKELGINF